MMHHCDDPEAAILSPVKKTVRKPRQQTTPEVRTHFETRIWALDNPTYDFAHLRPKRVS